MEEWPRKRNISITEKKKFLPEKVTRDVVCCVQDSKVNVCVCIAVNRNEKRAHCKIYKVLFLILNLYFFYG